MVWTAVSDKKTFHITVRVHQGRRDIRRYIGQHPRHTWAAPMLALVSEDIALADADNGRLVRHRKSWKVALESGGLKLNEAKIEFNSADPSPVRIVDYLGKRTDQVKYLWSVFRATNDIDCDVKARIATAWAKWRELTRWLIYMYGSVKVAEWIKLPQT